MISSIDIGNSRIACLMAVVNSEGKVCVKSASIHESKGIKNGNIVDINSTIRAIFETRIKAEKLMNKNISTLAVSISGDLIKSKRLKTSLKLSSGKVSKNDVFSLANVVYNTLKKNKKSPVHLVVDKIYVDGIEVKNPVGINGNVIKSDFYTMYVDSIKYNNLSTCFKNSNLKVDNYVFSAFASSLAVLNESEKQSGSLVIDMGAGLTSFCIIKDNKLLYGNSISIAGNAITKDISEILKINLSLAEKIKISNTNFYLNSDEESETISVDIDDDYDSFRAAKNTIKTINDIAKARIEEIIFMVFDCLSKKKLDESFNNIVITGGSANIYGLDNFVGDITKIKTRIGICDSIYTSSNIDEEKILDPSYSAAIGLLLFLNNFKDNDLENYKNKSGLFDKIIKFLINLFIA